MTTWQLPLAYELNINYWPPFASYSRVFSTWWLRLLFFSIDLKAWQPQAL